MHDRRIIVGLNDKAAFAEELRADSVDGDSQTADAIAFATLAARLGDAIFSGTWGEMNERAKEVL